MRGWQHCTRAELLTKPLTPDRTIPAKNGNFAPDRDRSTSRTQQMRKISSSAIAHLMPATPAWPPASTPRLFVDLPLAIDAAPMIDGPAVHYLLHVMRLKVGAPILLFDNRSGEWLASIADAGKRSLTLRIERQTRAIEPVPDLWLCFAPVKKARLDWIIEKATELGVARLQPVITERTIIERVKRERLEAQIIEACEQCGRTALPALGEPVKLAQLLTEWPAGRATERRFNNI